MLYKAVGEELEEIENAEAVPNLVLPGAPSLALPRQGCWGTRRWGRWKMRWWCLMKCWQVHAMTGVLAALAGRGRSYRCDKTAESAPDLLLTKKCHDRGVQRGGGVGQCMKERGTLRRCLHTNILLENCAKP